MKENFERGFKFVLEREGFISNDKQDPGKLTIFGISEVWHRQQVEQMRQLINKGEKGKALEIAKSIYKTDYWDKYKCDDLPSGIDIFVFDTGVNMNPKDTNAIINFFRKLVKEFYIEIGDEKLNKLLKMAIYNELALFRISLYKDKPKFNYFGRGWINRVLLLLDFLKKEFL